jgi:hypothetical protein
MTRPAPTAYAERMGARMVLAVLVAATVAACGGQSATSSSPGGPSSSATTTSTTAATSTRARHRRAARARRPPAHAAALGRAQRVRADGTTLSVTVSRVYGTLKGTGSALLPGTHAAGVQLTIINLAGATYDSTASGDVSVVVSSGMPTPLFIKRGVCETPLVDFESLISVGETRSGCVGFTVPHGARIVAVRFSPHSRVPGSVTWR